ncbi:unnamed protein product, partial [Lymnaea stagnalis]
LHNKTSRAVPHQKYVSDELYGGFLLGFSVVSTIMSSLGCLGNLVVIRTFVSLGLKEGVTVSFVFLAVSNLAYLIVMIANAVSIGVYVNEKLQSFKTWNPVDPFGMYVFFSNISYLLNLITILTTTYLAVVRCMCVAMPLQFKSALTRRRSVLILVAFCVVSIASYIPILVYMKIVRAFDAKVNATRYVLWISPEREEVKDVVWFTRDVSVTFITQIIVIVCVVIMVRCLLAASRFRRESMRYSEKREDTRNTESSVSQVHGSGAHQKRKANEAGSGHALKLSAKDMSVVQQVVLISVVYIVCNTPAIMVNTTVMLVEDFTLGNVYQNLYLTVLGAMELFQTFNSSFNVFIYYRYNKKFR